MPARIVNGSLAPTRKWCATQITALTGWVIALINVGHWTATIKIALATIVGQALIGWLVPNDLTPGGVPRPVKRQGQRGYVEHAVALALLIVLVAVILTVALHSPLWLLILVLLLLLLL